jgi:mRNA-degrading endonuclease RelE of RelBE toxin-antitoxin system
MAVVLFTQAALKEIAALPVKIKRQVMARAEALAADPFPPGFTKIEGVDPPRYRVRQGNHRIIYEVEDASPVKGPQAKDAPPRESTVYVVGVSDRKEAYGKKKMRR